MMRSFPIKPVAAAAALLFATAAPWLLNSYDLNLLARFLALSLTAMGLALLWGNGGVLSLGQGVFFGIGGYAIAMHLKLNGLAEGELPDFMLWSGRVTLPWWWAPFEHPLIAMLAVIVLPTCCGAFIAWIIVRRRIGGVYFALITQALALAFATLLISQQAVTGGFNGLTGFQNFLGFDLNRPQTSRGLYFATLALAAVGLIALRWLLASRFGKLLIASRDGASRLRFLGHNPTPIKVAAFAIASLFAGVSGALFTLHAGVISPALIGVVPSIEMVIWVAVGGRASLLGALVGALVVNVAKDRISTALPELWLYALGAMFVLAVTVLPGGLAGLLASARSRFSQDARTGS